MERAGRPRHLRRFGGVRRPGTAGERRTRRWCRRDRARRTLARIRLLDPKTDGRCDPHAYNLLPTFPVDSEHHLRYAVSLDGATPIELDLGAPATPRKSLGAGDGPADSGWSENVLRNSAVATIPLGPLASGKHTLRLLYRDPGVVFEHIVVAFPNAPPAYPVPPEAK